MAQGRFTRGPRPDLLRRRAGLSCQSCFRLRLRWGTDFYQWRLKRELSRTTPRSPEYRHIFRTKCSWKWQWGARSWLGGLSPPRTQSLSRHRHASRTDYRNCWGSQASLVTPCILQIWVSMSFKVSWLVPLLLFYTFHGRLKKAYLCNLHYTMTHTSWQHLGCNWQTLPSTLRYSRRYHLFRTLNHTETVGSRSSIHQSALRYRWLSER